MKSKLMLLTLALAGAMTVSAQSTKEKYTSNGSDNIFVSLTGGISLINAEGEMGSVAPHVTVSLGKWFNPVVGLRLQGGAWRANYDTKYSFGKLSGTTPMENAQSYHKTMGVVRLDGLYNLTNAICGYNPDRVFTLSAFAGPGLTFAKSSDGVIKTTDKGYTRTTANGKNEKLRALINGSVGLLGKFKVSEAVDIDVEARGEIAASYLGYRSNASTVGGLYLGAGLTYTFGGKNFVPVGCQVDGDALNNEINRLRSELAKSQSDLNDCRTALANVKPEVKEVEKLVEVAGARAIFFNLGSSRLTDYGKVHIQMAAKAMKENSNVKYKVLGYADKATGSASYNQKLSEKRAQAVVDALVAEGVSSSQLEVSANGGVDNMFGKNKLQRLVIIEK